MNVIRATLSAAGLFVATGAMGAAQADDYHNSTTLFTSATLGGRLSCNAVNVGRKTLTITISIIDGTGTEPTILEKAVTTKTDPGLEASNDHGAFTDPSSEGYCVFQISGTENPDDVRAVLVSSTERTPPTTPFPYFVTRVLEAR